MALLALSLLGAETLFVFSLLLVISFAASVRGNDAETLTSSARGLVHAWSVLAESVVLTHPSSSLGARVDLGVDTERCVNLATGSCLPCFPFITPCGPAQLFKFPRSHLLGWPPPLWHFTPRFAEQERCTSGVLWLENCMSLHFC